MAAVTSMPVSPTAHATPESQSRLRFADAFWDDNDHGVDILFGKLYKSRQTCEEIKKFYEIRSQIEQDYGNRLLKLSQHLVGRIEQGTLSVALMTLPTGLESVAQAHIDLGQKLACHLETPLDAFLHEQRELRRTQQQKTESARQLKNLHFANVAKTREFYFAECRKLDALYKCINDTKDISREKLEGVQREIEDTKKMVNAAEIEHQHAIEVYNSVLDDWVRSWVHTCDAVQDIEEKRLSHVCESLQTFANTMTATCNVDIQFCEHLKASVETTDVHGDLKAFVEKHSTGHDRPGHLYFVPYVFEERKAAMPTPASSIHQDLQSLSDSKPPVGATIETSHNEAFTSVNAQQHDTKNSSIEADRHEAQCMSEPQQENVSLESGRQSANIAAAQSPDTAKPLKDAGSNLASTGPTQSHTADQRLSEQPASNPSHSSAAPVPLSRIATTSKTPPLDTQETLKPMPSTEFISSQIKSDRQSTASLKSDDRKYKPVPNPDFKQSTVSSRVTDTSLNKASTDHSNSEAQVSLVSQTDTQTPSTATKVNAKSASENRAAHREPKPPAKDEKWVISSIRRPNQVPVRAQNARIYERVTSQRLDTPPKDMHTSPQRGPVSGGQPNPSPPPLDNLDNGQSRRPVLSVEPVGSHGENLQPQMTPSRTPTQRSSWHPGPNALYSPATPIVPPKQNTIHAASWADNRTSTYYSPATQATFVSDQPTETQRYSGYPSTQISNLPSLSVPGVKDDNPAYSGKKKDIGSIVKEVLRATAADTPNENLRPVVKEKPVKEKGSRFSRVLFGSRKEKRKTNKDEVFDINDYLSDSNPPINHSQPDSSYPTDTTIGVTLHDPPAPRPLSSKPPVILPLSPQDGQKPRLSDGTEIQEFARATWDFKATIPAEMSFNANDVLAIIKKQSDGWWVAELIHTQQRGLVPGNYLVTIDGPFGYP